MKEILIKSIKGELEGISTAFIRKNAKMFLSFYTGEKQDDILLDYRKNENKDQKEQRKRIYIPRTKHICSQIENLLDQLHVLDTPAVSIKASSKEEDINNIIYNNNLINQAFEFVKYYNIVDANALLVCGVDELGDIEFKAIQCENVLSYKIKNDRVEYLITQHEKEFRLYYSGGVITASEARVEGGEIFTYNNKRYYLTEVKTSLCYAIHLGYLKDARTNFRTFKTITDSASHLFVQLIWDGAELDTLKAVHGIIKTFAYAPKCTFVKQTEDGISRCVDGHLVGFESGHCPACNGSGMKIHTSSQDIIYVPEPMTSESVLSLDKMIHTVTIPDSILETRKSDIQETENKIIRTVFNGNSITRSDIAKTATEVGIEMKGLYSTLSKIGYKTSDVFIWMVECIADILGAKGVEVFHGYTLDLNIDTIEDLFNQRKLAIDSGASQDIIDVIDFAIQKKQHIDNPKALNRFAIWDQFRPFTDKSMNEKISIMATLPDNNYYKVLYTYWAIIKNNIEMSMGDKFFDLPYQRQKAEIDKEVQAIIETIPEPAQRLDFQEF
jgi:hypothetical protein